MEYNKVYYCGEVPPLHCENDFGSLLVVIIINYHNIINISGFVYKGYGVIIIP